jgi:antitoxin (DNA-binding transcriptional repressor) of toxin-antitoxin stability system
MVMKRAKVYEVKARLSAYLAEVKRGGTITVCERQTAIARLVPYEEEDREFKLRDAIESLAKLGKIRPVRLNKKVDVDRVLRETRGGR